MKKIRHYKGGSIMEKEKLGFGEWWIVTLSAIILAFIVVIFSILTNCVVVSCDSLTKANIEKENLEFLREIENQKQIEKFPNRRKQILEDCENLKDLIEKEIDLYTKASYENKYRKDCIDILVVK